MYYLINVRLRAHAASGRPERTTVVPIRADSWAAAITQLETEFPTAHGWIVDP